MKKVLITGAHGFLGRNVAKQFKVSGHHVTGIGHGKWEAEEYNSWGIDKWYETTITFEALLNINKQFDLIIHCGGSGSVAFSYGNPYEDFQKSVLSTLALLEFMRLQSPNSTLIYPSSPAVQGNLGDIQITEDMQSTPISPYGVHKKIAEDLCKSYNINYGLKIGIVRFFSIYGEGLQKQLLWDACRKLTAPTASFFGTGYETRDWIYVTDAAELIDVFSNHINNYEIVNGGSGNKTTIKDVLENLRDMINPQANVTFNGAVKEGDPVHFWSDNKKALSLGWQPKVSVEDGLQRYVSYFANLKK